MEKAYQLLLDESFKNFTSYPQISFPNAYQSGRSQNSTCFATNISSNII